MENKPLAERIRPRKLEDYIGQQKLLSSLKGALASNNLPSMILWGPPGVGKTTFALLLAEATKRQFFSLSAISSGIKELREVLHRPHGMFAPILFIDEIHRYNKTQQDALLGAVEKGTVTLVGATTENPSFEINAALLSRCQVYVLEAFGKEQLEQLVHRALKEDEMLKQRRVEVKSTDALLRLSGGDGRKLLNLLELTLLSQPENDLNIIDNDLVEHVAQSQMARYDKSGEQHYDIVSAFIKSMRGSDPNGALYWLARMLHGGEDLVFIARRMLILASEDIGLANPTAMIIANACMQAVQTIGYPESRIILSQTVIYLATSAKSNTAYEAIEEAMRVAGQTLDSPVPMHLRNAPTKLMKELGYGNEYAYAHAYTGNFVQQDFLPENLRGTQLYKTGKNPRETEINRQLNIWWKDWYGY
jgi:putative ATPase